ncbi:MAG: hypothetical protein E7474_11805 [Ruminococcaceae bacterium]|nr:hypothetical protein [Oscillospiraceae bacterium]
MRRKALVSLLAVCMLLLVACGGSGGSTPAPNNNTTPSNNQTQPQTRPNNQPSGGGSQNTAPGKDARWDGFFGLWENVDSNVWLELNSDETWAMYNSDGDVTINGTVVFEDEDAYLYDTGDNFFMTISITDAGRLTDSDSDRYVEATSYPSGGLQWEYKLGDFLGTWEVSNDNYLIAIYTDGTWQTLNSRGNVEYEGVTLMGDNELELYHSSSGDLYDTLTYYADGTLHNASGGVLTLVDSGAQVNADATAFFGSWNYEDQFYLYLYEDYTWGSWDNVGEYSPGEGTFTCDGDSVTLYFNNGDYYVTLYLYRGGDLIDEYDNIYAPIDMTA